MPDLNLRSIEQLVTILLVFAHAKCAKAKRRKQCLTAWKDTGPTGLRDAQSVMASLVSSGIIRGEFSFAPGSASIDSEPDATVTAIGWVGSNHLRRVAGKPRGPHDHSDLITKQRIFENCSDFALHRQSNDWSRDCGC